MHIVTSQLAIDLLITFASESHACLLAEPDPAELSSKQAQAESDEQLARGHVWQACAVAVLIAFFLRPWQMPIHNTITNHSKTHTITF